MLPGELDEIWELYADDGAQSLDLVELSLQNLKEAPADAGHIAALFRAIHTFKGNARVLGLANIEHCAHAAEDLIGLVRDENVPFDSHLLALLLEISDVLREMMNEFSRGAPTPPRRGRRPWLTGYTRRSNSAAPRSAGRQPPRRAEPEPEAIVFEPVAEAALAKDTGYLQIFTGMASDSLNDARAALDKVQACEPLDFGVLTQSLEPLRFAAGQMGASGLAGAAGRFPVEESPNRWRS